MIRLWQREDIPRIAELEALCFREPWTVRALADSMQNPFFEMLVSERGGRIVGYAGYQRALDEAQIANVATAPEARRTGVAREILCDLIRRWKEQGLASATLEVRPSNAAAISLYASLGFVREGRRPRFYSDGEDAELYRLTL